MALSLLIIDDFLSEAESFREATLGLDYKRPDIPLGYPGRNATQKIVMEGLDEAVSKLVGEPLKAHPQTTHCRPRITLENEVGTANVHIDNAHWSGILYLTKPEHCQGGTKFYKHLPTGTTRAVLEPSEMKKLGTTSKEEANKIFNDILTNDTHDMAKWEQVMEVPMVFNRLILFRPWLWHTASPGFGDSLENGRLIYPVFFLSAASG